MGTRSGSMVGERLRTFRKLRGLSIAEVVEQLFSCYKIKISDKTVYGWEAGRSQPDIETFLSLCEIYHVSNRDFAVTGEKIEAQMLGRAQENEYIRKYRCLDGHGKELVNLLLNKEYERCTEQGEAPAQQPYIGLAARSKSFDPDHIEQRFLEAALRADQYFFGKRKDQK